MWKKIHLQIYGVMERSDFLIHEVFLILRLTRLFWCSKKVLFCMNTWVIENYKHTKRVRKEFEIKNLSGYHDFYAQNNTLLLADVFESFQTKCIGIYSLDPVHFLSASKLPKSRIRATNWHWYVINDKKGEEADYVILFINMPKLITNTWKIMIKIKTHNILSNRI